MRQRLLSMLVVGALLAFTACEPSQVRAFAQGSQATAAVIETGIDTVRAFRQAGEISDERAVRLAEGAQKVNSALGSAVDLALEQPSIDEGRRAELHEQIKHVADELQQLVADGTIPIKNGRARLVFDLSVAGARASLASAGGAFSAPLKQGVSVPVDDESRARLEQARAAVNRNRERLHEALVRLKAAAPATPQ